MASTSSPSLQLVLVTSTVLLITASMGLTLLLSAKSGTEAMSHMVHGMESEIAASVTQQLRTYLDTPHRLNALNAGTLRAGLIDPQDDDALRRQFYQQAQLFPAAAYIQLGRPDGSFVGVERGLEGRFTAEVTDHPRTGKAVWALNGQGDPVGARAGFIEGYDATTRPWFKAAITAGQPTWSPIYQFSSRQRVRLGITAVQPYLFDEGAVGVLGTDIVLSHLSRFLDNPRLGEGGRIFIMERDGLLVAATAHREPFTTQEGEAQRLSAVHSDDPLTRAAALALVDLPLTGRVDLEIQPPSGRAHVAAQPLQDSHGVDWIVVVVLPEAPFLEPVRATQRALLLTGLLTLLLASLGAALIARWATRPLHHLVDSASAIARLDWEQPIPRGRTRDTQALARAFADMRARLQAAMLQSDQDRQAAQAANQAKSAFLRNMSHELRTPLNAIIGYSELLREEAEPQDREDLDKILGAARQLLALVEEVLDLARVESGSIELRPAQLQVERVLQGVYHTALPLVLDTGNRLVLDLPPAPGEVWADPTKLRQCLLNLLTNAAKFTAHGTITLRVIDQGETISFDVEDTGIGIPDHQLDEIFSPFMQIDPSATKRHRGVGLGLALTRRFAEEMGGELLVRSELGHGSTFTLKLPRQPSC